MFSRTYLSPIVIATNKSQILGEEVEYNITTALLKFTNEAQTP